MHKLIQQNFSNRLNIIRRVFILGTLICLMQVFVSWHAFALSTNVDSVVRERDTNALYLPIVSKTPFLAIGELSFVPTSRFEGLTTFVPSITLAFNMIDFTYTPQEMRIWIKDNEPNNWIAYQPAYTYQLPDPILGGQEIYVRFRYNNDTILKSAVFFYIPNGDFMDGPGGVETYWSPQNNGLPWSVVNNQLRLGSDTFGCTNVPFPTSATASILLNVPANGSYKLYVAATVYTHDKIPDPSQAIYDAFEIHLDGKVHRYGYSGPELLNCNTQRTIVVSEDFLLPSGNNSLRLENHSRFDQFYNTYTDINKVWVDK